MGFQVKKPTDPSIPVLLTPDGSEIVVVTVDPGGTPSDAVVPLSAIGGAVASVYGRVGAVVPVAGDYSAALVSFAPAGGLSAVDVQAALVELDTGKQPAGSYATAAQGALADTAVQPGNLAPVAFTGAYASLSGAPALATVATSGAYNDLTGKPSLATVATSGAYGDLTGKPTLGTLAALSSPLPVANGGTAGTTAGDARTSLGLGTIATQNANNVAISGGSVAGITDLTIADGGTGQSTAQAAINALTAVSGATIGHVLTKSAGGDAAWAAASGGGTPGGSNTQIQFNDSSAFGGDADLVWNKTTNVLTLTGAQTISSTLAVGGALISGTYLTVIDPATHTRLGVGSSSSARHSLVSFYDSTPTKRFDVGYDPAMTQFYIYDGTGNILQSTNAGVTTIGRSGGSVAFGVGALTLNAGSGNAYFSLTSTTTSGAMGHKYQQSGTDVWVVALMGSAVAASDQFGVGGAIRWYNQGLDYTGMLIEATKSMVSIGFGNPAAQLHVRQRSTTAAIPALWLRQADLSEEFVRFECTVGTGNAIEAAGAKVLTTTHFIRVYIEGVGARYMPVGTIA